MFYKYKVVSYTGEYFFLSSKQDLFDLIDRYGFRNFCQDFCEEVTYTVVKRKCFHQYGESEKEVTRNGTYTIRDMNGNIVYISDIVFDYKQSRNIKSNLDYWQIFYSRDTGSRKYQRRRSLRKHTGIIRERSSNEMAALEGVKTRTKRVNELAEFYSSWYGDYQQPHKSNWKEKKVARQWMKNKRS